MLYSSQHNEVHKINAFYAEMFSFLFLVVAWSWCPIKVINVTYGNSFSNQWAITMLKTEVLVFQVQLFKLLYRKNYASYFVEICTADVK